MTNEDMLWLAKAKPNIFEIPRSAPLGDAADGVTQDGNDTTGVLVEIHERIAVNSVFAFPSDGEPRIRLLEIDIFRIAIPRQPHGRVICCVEQPGISSVGREQCQRANCHKATVMLSGATLDVSDLIRELEILAVDVAARLARV